METNIIIHGQLKSNAVIKAAKDLYKIKMNKEQLKHLADMLFQCIEYAALSEGNELDILLIEELRKELEGKYYAVEHKASMKLKPSQAHVLFFWLNEGQFENATYHMFACNLVDQLYKQIV